MTACFPTPSTLHQPSLVPPETQSSQRLPPSLYLSRDIINNLANLIRTLILLVANPTIPQPSKVDATSSRRTTLPRTCPVSLQWLVGLCIE
ncbi:hypothetical protein BJ508DRAFT_145352 [Ascobolus immersus RN42]|uniref:Uncharacterized protein n=1 Tax=Ascobolus immersus RN42 TaxID=1160509 RepID=A0A3N4I109_ASCIM|nr:hypothetical protein BJ508DRAFT_145352 [Ascobolus immersus RN42]